MIHYQSSRSLTDAFMTLQMLRSLNALYPDFEFWFVNKAMPGILLGRDVLITAVENNRIVGVALGKRTEDEVKMRCIRVLPEYQKRGVGIHLIDHLLRALNHDRPVCTVAEEMLHDFARPFINRFGFTMTEVLKGFYRRGKLEYVFNGVMAVPTPM